MKKLTALLIAAFAMNSHGQERYPVRWTELVDLRSRDEIPALLLERVSPGENSTEQDRLEIPATSVFGVSYRKPVYTGEEYLQAIKEGYRPEDMGNYDRTMAGFFVDRVIPLALLHIARPAVTSYVEEVRLNRVTLKDIPAAVDTFRQWPVEPEISVLDECPEFEIEERTSSTLSWQCITYGGGDREYPVIWAYALNLLAWADFDGDGIEDMLCSFYMNFLTGRNVNFYTVILTRKEPGGMLKMVGLGEDFLIQHLQ